MNNLIPSETDPDSTDIIAGPSGSCSTLAYDNTADNNLRYVGEDPCNYVKFNDELWRIIGFMNNIDDGTGHKETRIKIIRKNSITPAGHGFSWDSSESAISGGRGVNDWTQADLKNELNGDYLDTSLTEDPYWVSGKYNQKKSIFDHKLVLKSSAQKLIGNAVWNLGGIPRITEITLPELYNYERGASVWGSTSDQTCNDGACPRATKWTGKVGLYYPSDTRFSVGGSNSTRTMCIRYKVNVSNGTCSNNNFLGGSDLSTSWSITPVANLSYFATFSYGFVYTNFETYQEELVNPVVYLKSDVKLLAGNGTQDNPYIFG